MLLVMFSGVPVVMSRVPSLPTSSELTLSAMPRNSAALAVTDLSAVSAQRRRGDGQTGCRRQVGGTGVDRHRAGERAFANLLLVRYRLLRPGASCRREPRDGGHHPEHGENTRLARHADTGDLPMHVNFFTSLRLVARYGRSRGSVPDEKRLTVGTPGAPSPRGVRARRGPFPAPVDLGAPVPSLICCVRTHAWCNAGSWVRNQSGLHTIFPTCHGF